MIGIAVMRELKKRKRSERSFSTQHLSALIMFFSYNALLFDIPGSHQSLLVFIQKFNPFLLMVGN